MSVTDALKRRPSSGGRSGLARSETRDPIGYAVAALGTIAGSDLLDRLGLRKRAEQAVFTATRGGFTVMTRAGRAFTRRGTPGEPGTRVPAAGASGVFDLTPTEDQRMLLDVVTEFTAEVVRSAAAQANEDCAAPPDVVAPSIEIGLPLLGVPEALGGISEERSAMTGTLVAEALGKGDMGLAVALLAPGSVATALSLWGSQAQQATYLPAFTGEDVAAAALALAEPRVGAEVLRPATTARRDGDGFVLDGVKSNVPRGGDAELFLVGASLDGAPALFVLEAGTEGLEVEADPSMGVRASTQSRLHLRSVRVPAFALLGEDVVRAPEIYREAVRLSRLAWCGLAVGTAQAVLDYVTPYVKERQAFGEPVAHRQSVAFMVANIAIELQAMRLVTYRAAARAAAGEDFGREVALARNLCTTKGMQIGLDGVQLLGGHGFVKEHPVERWYRDLRAVGVMEGGVLV